MALRSVFQWCCIKSARLLGLSVVLLVVAVACQTLPLPEKNGTEGVFRNDPALVSGSLENGFRYVLMNNKEPENRVSMHLLVMAGSLEETEEQLGLAHFLEHMLFNGTEHYPPGELVKYFQSIGMQFGADANAHTGFQETVYDVLLPMGDRKNLEDGLLVMHDYASTALLLEEEVEREKNVILAEKRDRDSASYRVFEKTLMFELPDMRLSGRLPIGTAKTIKNASRQILKEYYDTWYRPDNMVLVAVGDFDTSLAEELVVDKFKTLTARAPSKPHPDPGNIAHAGTKAFHHYEKEIGKTSVSIEVLTKIPHEKDSLDNRFDALVDSIANRIVQNRLDALIRKPDTPFTSATASSGIFLKHVKYGDISADCSPLKWEQSLKLIEQSLRQALEFGFTEGELNRVKQNVVSALEQGAKTATTRNSSSLSSQIIRSITEERMFLSPQDKLNLYQPFITTLALDEVNNAFREIWSVDHRLVVVTGNAPLEDDRQSPEEIILRAYTESRGVAVTKPVMDEKVTFPYLPEPDKIGALKHKEWIDDLGITVVEFENGFRLNLKKTDYKANQILFKIDFGGGKVTEPENKAGLAYLSTRVINESGLGQLTGEELKRALAGKNTGMMFSVGEESFSLSGSSVPEEVRLMFQLIRAYLLDPGLKEDAYSLAMERMQQKYEELSKTIEGAETLYGRAFLAGGDSRFGLPEYHEFQKNSLDDVKNWAGKAILGAVPEVSVVGDFDSDELIRSAAKYIGTIHRDAVPEAEKGIVAANRKPPEFPAGGALNLTVDTKIPKALVKVAYPTDDFWDISRTRRLSALGAVFREKLRNSVREELGAAYSPFAYNHSSTGYPGYGVFHAVVTVAPEMATLVSDNVKSISKDLAKNGVTEDELRRAVDPLLTSIRDMRRTNSYWLNSVLSNSGRHPEKFDWARSIEMDYKSISLDDIKMYSEKYLDNSKAATMVIKPKNSVKGK